MVLFFYKRQERKHAFGNGIILFNSSKQEPIPSFVEEDLVKRGEYYYLKTEPTNTDMYPEGNKTTTSTEETFSS